MSATPIVSEELRELAKETSNSFTLQNILGENHDSIQHSRVLDEISEGWDEVTMEETVAEQGLCVECEDQPSQLYCETCSDNFCQVCFAAQHRKGSRKRHVTKPLKGHIEESSKRSHGLTDPQSDANGRTMDIWENGESQDPGDKLHDPQRQVGGVGEWFVERAKFIPLRLSLSERKYLRLLEAALQVSEYTDKIDTYGHSLSKAKRVVHQIRELCAILSGLVLSTDYKHGQELFANRDFAANAEFYQEIFEIGRRHKIVNPDKMRTTYGKLIYLLQDSQAPEVKDLLNFSCVRPINTVYSVLEEHDALDLLRDDEITVATKEIYAEGRTRREIQQDIRSKERAIETLAARFERTDFSREQVRQCLYSIGDNHAFLRVNRDPCDRMIAYLKEYFHPTRVTDNKSNLAIRMGKGGARLSHSHPYQYAYVLQSLTLWREILHDMFHLWFLAERDLLSERVPYKLRGTGQGLNRVQPAPKTSRMMQVILDRAHRSVDSWVGSSVVHMGDHNVPNALMFIDKYTQIYRILLPICNTLSQIPNLVDKPAIRSYIDDEFGSPENLTQEILVDFFRHGFDGSGADNFFDAGSCIDGRLTSAWNWCSLIEKKRYFPIFLLTGFTGFDGQW